MIINGIKMRPHKLRYDQILKRLLAQSNVMTIRLINGMLNDHIPLDAPVEWLDKESSTGKATSIVADFYPRIDGRIYAIEVEQDGDGDMAVRVFRYTVGGAMYHSMTSTKSEVNITFPQPCVVFLSNTKKTPRELKWNITFFDGQTVALSVPVIRLSDLSVKEIAERNLFPIGQFLLRKFYPLTAKKEKSFRDTANALLAELKVATEAGAVPRHIAEEMQQTIRETIDNILFKYGKGVGLDMTTSITDTIEWIDYKELYEKLEERGVNRGKAEGEAKGKAEGKAEGEAKRNIEIARAMLAAGEPVEKIILYTGLTREEIEKLRDEMKPLTDGRE